LLRNAPAVLQERAPHVVEAFARRNWELPASIDRVYVIERAEKLLGYRPVYGFDEFIDELERGAGPRPISSLR
jgi:UDP-glucose 4-epimerase